MQPLKHTNDEELLSTYDALILQISKTLNNNHILIRLTANEQQKTHQQFSFFTLSRSDALARARTSLRVSFMIIKSADFDDINLKRVQKSSRRCACASASPRVRDNSASQHPVTPPRQQQRRYASFHLEKITYKISFNIYLFLNHKIKTLT